VEEFQFRQSSPPTDERSFVCVCVCESAGAKKEREGPLSRAKRREQSVYVVEECRAAARVSGEESARSDSEFIDW